MALGLGSALTVLVAGGLIGATGIGGVLVVPALTALQGLAPQDAITAAALAFAFPGLAALYWLRRSPGNAGRSLLALVAGALPAAFAGAALVHHLPPAGLLAGLAALALVSGLRGLLPASRRAPAEPLGTPSALGLGAAVGLGSGLTGTGGPVFLIPLMLLARQPLAGTIAAAQAIQLPLALCASLPHWRAGRLDLVLAAGLGLLLLAGSVVGQRLARRMPVHQLQRGVCLLLLATGAWLSWRAWLLCSVSLP